MQSNIWYFLKIEISDNNGSIYNKILEKYLKKKKNKKK
jgi:hypothetical protein